MYLQISWKERPNRWVAGHAQTFAGTFLMCELLLEAAAVLGD